MVDWYDFSCFPRWQLSRIYIYHKKQYMGVCDLIFLGIISGAFCTVGISLNYDDIKIELLVIQWYIVWLLKLLGFLLFFPTFAQPLSYNYEKTNGPISTTLLQDLGSCLNCLIFTLNHLSNERQPGYITLGNNTISNIIT